MSCHRLDESVRCLNCAAYAREEVEEIFDILRQSFRPNRRRLVHGPNVSIVAAKYVRIFELLEKLDEA